MALLEYPFPIVPRSGVLVTSPEQFNLNCFVTLPPNSLLWQPLQVCTGRTVGMRGRG